METEQNPSCGCGGNESRNSSSPGQLEMLPMFNGHSGQADDPDEPCCGPPAGPASSRHEKPGYAIHHFVDDFLSTSVGPVPVVKTRYDLKDRLGTAKVRTGICRNDYKVAPGMYAVGQPEKNSPVLVTANYKLSFDHLRVQLTGVDAWLLVLDTRGINVWCAAGKGTFGTQEVIRQVLGARLAQVVDHRKIILPQLGAPGVSAQKVKKGCGFEIVWGPVRAQDVPAFLAAGHKAETQMRRVTFTMAERMVLAPVEISLARKPILWVLAASFILSGIGSHVFSFGAAWQRGLIALSGCLAGVLAGCIIVPMLLPWIPGRAFAIKGALIGFGAGILVVTTWFANEYLSFGAALAVMLLTTTISSFLAMNFTGTTPFTSPSGVENEMRKAIPIQIGATVMAAGLWIVAGF